MKARVQRSIKYWCMLNEMPIGANFQVERAQNTSNIGGVWIRDLWADDIDNECNCGAFPILRAANEAVGRSTCKLPNCPTVPHKN